MPKVERILRFGSHYYVHLTCGCTYKLTSDDLKRQQIYIGKLLRCQDPNH